VYGRLKGNISWRQGRKEEKRVWPHRRKRRYSCVDASPPSPFLVDCLHCRRVGREGGDEHAIGPLDLLVLPFLSCVEVMEPSGGLSQFRRSLRFPMTRIRIVRENSCTEPTRTLFLSTEQGLQLIRRNSHRPGRRDDMCLVDCEECA
jgi:hypothetical protein